MAHKRKRTGRTNKAMERSDRWNKGGEKIIMMGNCHVTAGSLLCGSCNLCLRRGKNQTEVMIDGSETIGQEGHSRRKAQSKNYHKNDSFIMPEE